MAGILVGLFGVILITLLPILTKGGSVTGHITGNIFFVVQIFIWSLYTIGSRHLTSVKGYSPTTISGISFFTTTFVFGLISIFTVQQKHVAAALVPSNILLLLYLGIFVTVITYLLYQWAIKYSSATTATLNSYIGPVFAIGINCLFLGESITLAILFGLVLILSGLWMIGGSDVLQKMKGVRIR
jgi:drug/metabolite transporter (DMT)-like permease